ncbi:MAG: sulfite exporter TauE/SafE family protein [Phycisphaerales bacterium]|nr:MAG: sulfite exporter TauE/SafE family protein [Phycisphaerales bacterium]
MFEASDLAIAAFIGVGAGLVGGLAGVGGSIIMLPALALFVGFSTAEKTEQHLYAAAAMAVNFVVALPAARTHLKKVDGPVLSMVRWLLPAALVGIVVGVLVSNQVQGDRLKLLLAAFIAAYSIFNLFRAFRPKNPPNAPAPAQRPPAPALAATGGFTGLAAGVLGIGGGIVLVPVLQLACRVPIKPAIAASSAVMAVTAILGASLKLGTLGEHGLDWRDGLLLAGAMAPGAIAGSMIGSALTHALPTRVFRIVLSVILLAAAARMAGIL